MPVVKRYSFIPGSKLISSQLNTNFDDIYNTFNAHTHTGQGNDANQITSSGIAPGGSLLTTNFRNPYKFYVYRTSSFTSAASGGIQIIFDTVSYDTGSNYNTSTGYFTVPVTGYYWFSARASVGNGQNGRTFVNIQKNGSELIRGTDLSTTLAVPLGSNVSGILQLNAGDQIAVGIYWSNSPGQGLEIGYVTTYFMGQLVSLG